MVHPWSGVTNSLHRVESVRRNAGRRLVWAKLRKTSNWSITLPGYPRPDNGHCKIPKVVRRAAYPDDRDIRKLRPTRRVLNRGQSRVLRFQSVVGSGVIAAQRTNTAHLHRPRRATCECRGLFMLDPGRSVIETMRRRLDQP